MYRCGVRGRNRVGLEERVVRGRSDLVILVSRDMV